MSIQKKHVPGCGCCVTGCCNGTPFDTIAVVFTGWSDVVSNCSALNQQFDLPLDTGCVYSDTFGSLCGCGFGCNADLYLTFEIIDNGDTTWTIRVTGEIRRAVFLTLYVDFVFETTYGSQPTCNLDTEELTLVSYNEYNTALIDMDESSAQCFVTSL